MTRKTPSFRFALILGLVALVLVPTAFAGKGGNRPSGGGTLNLVLMDGATEAHHYGRITFDVSTTATDRPFVGLRCWQGSNWVADGYVGYFPDFLFDPWFVLDSDYWADGIEATCTARLFYYNKRGGENLLATTSFTALP